MRLSACILTRDEPGALRRALASLAPVRAFETIVVANEDTSAGTHEVAREFGARVIAIRWEGSFAAARNAGMEAARGDWAFWLDTDEELVAGDAGMLERYMARESALAYYVRIEDAGTEGPMTERHHRSLVRVRGDIRYVGRVHEHFEPALEERGEVLLSEIRVRHGGYEPGRTAGRLRRNVELMEMELSERPGQMYYLIELGRSLLLLDDRRGHEVLAEAARGLDKDAVVGPVPLVVTLLEYAMAHGGEGFGVSAEEAVVLGERWFPRSPPLLFRAAQLHYRQGRSALAGELLKRVLKLGESGGYDADPPFDQRVFGDETRLNLATCLARAGDVGAARGMFEALARGGGAFAGVAAGNLKRLTGG